MAPKIKVTPKANTKIDDIENLLLKFSNNPNANKNKEILVKTIPIWNKITALLLELIPNSLACCPQWL
jgi:hypothetical protein